MQNPNQGMNNPNQNPYTGGATNNPEQDPYRTEAMNPPGQDPYRRSDMNPPEQDPYQQNPWSKPGQEPNRRDAAPMPNQEPGQQSSWNRPGQEPYRRDATPPPNQEPGQQGSWNRPGQETYQREASNMPGQESFRSGTMSTSAQGTAMGGTVNRQEQAPAVTNYAVPGGLPFNQQEWQTLVATPIQVSLAMMSVSPTGLIGMVQEAMAIGKSIQALQAQGNTSPLLAQLGQQLTKGLEDMRAGRQSPFGDIRQATQNPEMARNTALSSSQRSAAILERTSPRDAVIYKQFVYSFAYNVAAAAREGGFLGLFGGEQISQAENAFLNEIAAALRLQHS
ncbi:hypothetical protein [Dictyobacter kobayashii]|uniref:Uncharacterized protein n=1 Tax=Dictyobacter kobayashii TaxID=2014872 RepID=A0A402AVG0_9CHLR|nr:hypothetical protein [Dictyobacter kobayashii]GCE23003.1 hypothetical protein KDK_68030 [Dictyobacter kobayashii]